MERDEGLVYEEGDEINAQNLNDWEDRISNADASATTALQSHTNAANPHSGSASTTSLNNHVNNRSNPHGVTASQVGAPNNTNGIFTNQVTLTSTASGGGSTSYSSYMLHQMGTDGNVYLDFRTTSSGWLFRDRNSNARYLPVYASNTSLPSDRELKTEIKDSKKQKFEYLYDIPIYDFHYKAETQFDDGKEHTNMMAQDVYEVMPEVCWCRQDGTVEGINMGALVPYVIQMVRAQKEEIDLLKEQVETLIKPVVKPKGGKKVTK